MLTNVQAMVGYQFNWL